MRKVQFTAVFWTMALAIPFTVLAISCAAYLTDHASAISAWINGLSRSTTAGGRGWVLEFAERWPEVAGMIVGQLVILTILIFARQANKVDENQS